MAASTLTSINDRWQTGADGAGLGTAITNHAGILDRATAADLCTADSTTVTNTTTQTAFNASGTILKHSLASTSLTAGTVLEHFAHFDVSGVNSPNTLRLRLYYGNPVSATDFTGSTLIFDSTALGFSSGTQYQVCAKLVFRAVGGSGSVAVFPVGNFPTDVVAPTVTSVDTTSDKTLYWTATWSAANSGNVVAMRSLNVKA
mgnify:CR=1 FL=1